MKKIDKNWLSPIEEYNGVFYKRDDLFVPFEDSDINGGKVRQALSLFENNIESYKKNGVITSATKNSPQGLIIATIARHNNVECVVGIATRTSIEKVCKNHKFIDSARDEGASIIKVTDAFYTNSINYGIEKLAKKENYNIIKFGINATENKESIFGVIADQTKNLPDLSDGVDNLIIPVGSGLIFSGIVMGLQKYNKKYKRIIGILSGSDSRSTIKKNLKDIKDIIYELYRSDIKYNDLKTIDKPFKFDPVYEAKTILWFNKNKPTGKSCIWIVGNQGHQKEMKKIKHLDKEIKVKYFNENMTHEECKKIRGYLHEKPTDKTVKIQMYKIHQGSSRYHHIMKRFIIDLLRDVKGQDDFWSFNEFVESDDLLRVVSGNIESNPPTPNRDGMTTFDTMLKLRSPKMRSASNYPINSVRTMLKTYMPKNSNRYYDYSCGWGSRLLGSLSTGNEYFGTDPNHYLTEKLQEMGMMYKQTCNSVDFHIKTQGSEVFIPQWENTIGVAFSSPPYFNLEDYQHGDQSINKRGYSEWLEEYWRETIKNISRYLIEDGVFLLNIKNIRWGFQLLTDMQKIAEQEGFIYQHAEELIVPKRPHLLSGSSNEEILVFTKGHKIDLDLKDQHRVDKYQDFKKKTQDERQAYYTKQAEEKRAAEIEKEKSMIMVDPDDFKKTAQSLKSFYKPKRKTLTKEERKALKAEKADQKSKGL